jgi:hypothetical protein
MASWQAWSRLRAEGQTENGRRRPRLGRRRAQAAINALRNGYVSG